MAPFSAASQARLVGVHPVLVALVTDATEVFDCTILQGVRSKADQVENVAKGLSETLDSKHIPQADGLAHAVDVASTPELWEAQQETRLTRYDVQQIYFLGFLKGMAHERGVKVRVGVDWDNDNHWDGLTRDKPFLDTDHIEIVVE